MYVKDVAFKAFKSALTSFVTVVITLFGTASEYLGGIIEYLDHYNQYNLIIDEVFFGMNTYICLKYVENLIEQGSYQPLQMIEYL